MTTTVNTFAIELTDTNTGVSTRGVYRYGSRFAAELDALRLQLESDSLDRPVKILVVMTDDMRRVESPACEQSHRAS